MLVFLDSTALLKLRSENPSPPSPRGIGVAAGSTETTDRMGKTWSVVSGLRAEILADEVEDVRASLKILTEVVLGRIPTMDVRGSPWSSERSSSETEWRCASEEVFEGI